MKILTEIFGNLNDGDQWKELLKNMNVEYAELDQWTAQKSRFLIHTDKGNEYAVSLLRHTPLRDGDIIEYDKDTNIAVVLKLALNQVMVIDLSSLQNQDRLSSERLCFEIGHALGNQHWPALMKNEKIFVPLTVDKKVMQSVLDTHHFEGITYEFKEGSDIIPYLHPHEIRRLFGATGPDSKTHSHTHI